MTWVKSWIKIDTRIRSHPKLLTIAPDWRWFYVCSLCYSADYRTDGLIPTEALSSIVPDAKRPRSATKPLTSAGLWMPVDGGWQIHDYADYQQSSAESNGAPRAGAPAPADARARAGVPAHAPGREEVEVEVEVEKNTPPKPPSRGARAKERASYEEQMVAWTAWHFPNLDWHYVAHYADLFRVKDTEPTVENLRPLVEPHWIPQ